MKTLVVTPMKSVLKYSFRDAFHVRKRACEMCFYVLWRAHSSPAWHKGFQRGAAPWRTTSLVKSSALYRTSRGPREAACQPHGQRWFTRSRKIKPVLDQHRLYLSLRIARYSVTQLRRTPHNPTLEDDKCPTQSCDLKRPGPEESLRLRSTMNVKKRNTKAIPTSMQSALKMTIYQA